MSDCGRDHPGPCNIVCDVPADARCPECGQPIHPKWESPVHDDIVAILRALNLGDHARPISTHAVVHREILPAIESLRR